MTRLGSLLAILLTLTACQINVNRPVHAWAPRTITVGVITPSQEITDWRHALITVSGTWQILPNMVSPIPIIPVKSTRP